MMRFLLILGLVLGAHGARAQAPANAPPPAVGVARVEARPVREATEFVGRVVSPERVDIVARVSAFVEARQFTEGAEVKAGAPLFKLERAPFEAAVAQQEGALALAEARVEQTEQALARAQSLAGTPAGLRSALDDSRANHLAAQANVRVAKAQLDAARINLAYTEIVAPIDGRIGRASVSVGNVVGPNSGPLVSIVSQDPMYVTFPVAVRTYLELQKRFADRGGMEAVRARLRLPDGSIYDHTGPIDFTAPSVAGGTDTILMRAKLPNPKRRLIDGAFVAVTVEGIEPVTALTLPRQAVLADVRGNYVFVVGADNKAERRNIRLGPSTPETAVIADGVREGEMVIVDGVQRARPGIVVNPAPVAPPPNPAAAPGQAQGNPPGASGR